MYFHLNLLTVYWLLIHYLRSYCNCYTTGKPMHLQIFILASFFVLLFAYKKNISCVAVCLWIILTQLNTVPLPSNIRTIERTNRMANRQIICISNVTELAYQRDIEKPLLGWSIMRKYRKWNIYWMVSQLISICWWLGLLPRPISTPDEKYIWYKARKCPISV